MRRKQPGKDLGAITFWRPQFRAALMDMVSRDAQHGHCPQQRGTMVSNELPKGQILPTGQAQPTSTVKSHQLCGNNRHLEWWYVVSSTVLKLDLAFEKSSEYNKKKKKSIQSVWLGRTKFLGGFAAFPSGNFSYCTALLNFNLFGRGRYVHAFDYIKQFRRYI